MLVNGPCPHTRVSSTFLLLIFSSLTLRLRRHASLLCNTESSRLTAAEERGILLRHIARIVRHLVADLVCSFGKVCFAVELALRGTIDGAGGGTGVDVPCGSGGVVLRAGAGFVGRGHGLGLCADAALGRLAAALSARFAGLDVRSVLAGDGLGSGGELGGYFGFGCRGSDRDIDGGLEQAMTQIRMPIKHQNTYRPQHCAPW